MKFQSSKLPKLKSKPIHAIQNLIFFTSIYENVLV
jgi:hypothetical protein